MFCSRTYPFEKTGLNFRPLGIQGNGNVLDEDHGRRLSNVLDGLEVKLHVVLAKEKGTKTVWSR